MKTRTLIFIGSLLMALAVGFGAFGAHIVKEILTPERFEVYQTAVQYHFYHSLGILILGTISVFIKKSTWLNWAGYFMIAGTLIFCGSLYTLTLADIAWLGAVTPFGGGAFILGWICLVIGVALVKEH